MIMVVKIKMEIKIESLNKQDIIINSMVSTNNGYVTTNFRFIEKSCGVLCFYFDSMTIAQVQLTVNIILSASKSLAGK